VFENLLNKTTPTAAAAQPDKKPSAIPPDGTDTPAETQVWHDKIRAAAPDDAVLLQLAHQAPSTPLKLAAIEALTQEESFRQAMHDFREHDKRLYRAAKSRWELASGKRVALTEATSLIAGARALLDQDVIPVNRVVELDRAWAAVDSVLLDAELPAEFATLSAQLGEKVRERGELGQAVTRWLTAADGAMASLSETLPGVARGDLPAAESEKLAVNLLELVQSVPDAGDTRCIEKADAANRLLALAFSVVQRANFLQSLPVSGITDEANEKQVIEQWRGFPEMSEGELHTVLATRFADWRNASTDDRQREHDAQSAQERAKRAEQNKQRLNAIERDVAAAEAAQADGHIADLTRLLTTIDHALKRGAVNAVLNQRIEVLRAEQRRLHDWQRWSGGQGREQLATEAQALAQAATGKVAIKAHTEAIDKLRERWKELDKLGGASNQIVWLAFDGALKAAYAPVAAHLDKLKLAREENLAAREQIIAGLVQAAGKFFPVVQEGATPVTPDWRALSHTLDEAQLAWRKLGPVEHTVPRKSLQGDNAVTARYAKAVEALEAPLKIAHGDARQQREQLIAVAKELAASNVTARDVVDKVRKLQTQWQAVAKSLPLPRRDENNLWTAFKTATDAIFTARDAARAASNAEFDAKIKTREDIIERVSALSSLASAPDIKRAVTEADTAWRACAEVPKSHAARLDARYRAARDSATRRIGEIAVHASQARYDALIAKMALCHERELAQASGNAMTDEQTAELEVRWNAVEHLPDAWKAKLEVRFQGGNSTQALMPAAKPGKTTGENLPDFLLNLEIACGLESPDEFLADRQRRKMLALKTAMEGRQAVVTTPADIERWLLDAAASPHPDETSRERLAKIIAAVRVRRPG
jgi:exonuclease SbcC